jgi:uncharacterized membrane protein YkvA (DUF1232 family)
MSQAKFVEWVTDGIVMLPQYLKSVLRVLDDPDIEDNDRVLIAGALLHCIAGQNAIPGVTGMLGMVDDVLVLRLTLERLRKTSVEPMVKHFAEEHLFAALDDELASAREFLGELIMVLDKAVDGLPKITHQGHSAKECAEDSDWLYDAVQESLVEQFEFDEDDVARETKHMSKILQPLKSRVASLK